MQCLLSSLVGCVLHGARGSGTIVWRSGIHPPCWPSDSDAPDSLVLVGAKSTLTSLSIPGNRSSCQDW
jgi:hypothetical protein